MTKNNALVQIKNLTIGFRIENGYFEAVDSLSFSIHKGESVGLVGESGCGKTISSMMIIKLLPSPPAVVKQGEILFSGEDVLKMEPSRLREIRGKEVGVIFQEPMTHLNPVKKIGVQVSEPLRIHYPELSRKELYDRSILMMREAGLSDPERIYASYPHTLSGGMRQRVGTAIAMILRPRLLIADEPTTSLDVTIQAQIMDLMKHLKQEHKMSLLLITHNMGLVSEMCSRIVVMYAGRVAETALRKSIFNTPLHPYTLGLLSSIPLLSQKEKTLKTIPGSVPHPKEFLKGCRFLPRCTKRFKRCEKELPPPLFQVEDEHFVSCWLYENK
jgi:peptide/nickel transport system ATP-binding protein